MFPWAVAKYLPASPGSCSACHMVWDQWIKPSTVVKNISPFGLAFLSLHLLFICEFLTSLGRLLSVCLQVLDFWWNLKHHTTRSLPQTRKGGSPGAPKWTFANRVLGHVWPKQNSHFDASVMNNFPPAETQAKRRVILCFSSHLASSWDIAKPEVEGWVLTRSGVENWPALEWRVGAPGSVGTKPCPFLTLGRDWTSNSSCGGYRIK